MTMQEEINKDDKIIYEFLGINPEEIMFEYLFYNDWKSLMMVFQKIESLSEVDETLIRYDSVNQTYSVEIMSAYKDFPHIKIFGRNSRIKAVYNAVVSFIKNYNEYIKN